jgi:hypothetical protein
VHWVCEPWVPPTSSSVMLCYAMLCHVMLCYVMLCYVMGAVYLVFGRFAFLARRLELVA